MAGLLGAAALSSGQGFLSKIKQATGLEEKESNPILAQINEATTLSWKQRFIGFGVCMGVGLLLSILSIPLLFFQNYVGFAICYSLGSITSICSTMFLMGPVNQVKRMFDSHRIIATVVFLAAIAGTLAVAFKTGNALLCILMIIVQFCALVWYCITYIPGGQSTLRALILRQ